MNLRLALISVMLFSTLFAAAAPPAKAAAPPAKSIACRRAVIDGEVVAGQPYSKAIGNGLEVYLQPIHSGWILRVVPQSGPAGDHDYAELATPPYQSMTPLSISTDFAFRSQDAVAWNPRRFRFATSAAAFHRLEDVYLRFEQAGATPPAPLQVELSSQISEASEGAFTILDARLIPGTADQWRMAAAVASHFASTAHTAVQETDRTSSPLGRIVWLRFRLDLDLPPNFPADHALRAVPRICGSR